MKENSSELFDEIMRFHISNQIIYTQICNEQKSNQKLLPFVGAGLSAFAYGTWHGVLDNMISDLPDGSDIRNDLAKHLADGDYYYVAETFCKELGKNSFYNYLNYLFLENKINDSILKSEAAYLVPEICDGNCITTNFDRVMEHACSLHGIIYDIAIPTDTRRLNTYLRSGNTTTSAMIFKVHGDILSNSKDIIFTGSSYDDHYHKNSELRSQLIKWVSCRKILFLGSSLMQDRTVDILRECLSEGSCNYAIYGCRKEEIVKHKKRLDDLNIQPLFYDSANHNNLRIILEQIMSDSCSGR